MSDSIINKLALCASTVKYIRDEQESTDAMIGFVSGTNYIGLVSPAAENQLVTVVDGTATISEATLTTGVWFCKNNNSYTALFLYKPYDDSIVEVTWDGDTTGITDIFLVSGEMNLYKVSDLLYTSSQLENGYISVPQFGAEYVKNIATLSLVSSGDVISLEFNSTPYILVVLADTVYLSVSLHAGTYFLYMSSMNYLSGLCCSAGSSVITAKDYTINKGIATKVVDNMFTTVPTGKLFDKWAIGSTEGTLIAAGTNYAFADSTDLYAIWKDAT